MPTNFNEYWAAYNAQRSQAAAAANANLPRASSLRTSATASNNATASGDAAVVNATRSFIADPAPEVPAWTFQNNGNGTGQIDLGRYSLALNEHHQQWVVTDKQTGAQTSIWGDPHVDYQNDGTIDLDFKHALTLNLAGGLKINCQTIPYYDANGNHNNGATVSSRLTITDGRQALEVRGLAAGQDEPLAINKVDLAQAKAQVTTNDTTVYQGSDGSWYVTGGLLKNGALRDDGTIDFSKVEGSRRLSKQDLIDGTFNFSLTSVNDEEEEEEVSKRGLSTRTDSNGQAARMTENLFKWYGGPLMDDNVHMVLADWGKDHMMGRL
jgi:hypothetical protein